MWRHLTRWTPYYRTSEPNMLHPIINTVMYSRATKVLLHLVILLDYLSHNLKSAQFWVYQCHKYFSSFLVPFLFSSSSFLSFFSYTLSPSHAMPSSLYYYLVHHCFYGYFLLFMSQFSLIFSYLGYIVFLHKYLTTSQCTLEYFPHLQLKTPSLYSLQQMPVIHFTCTEK